MILPLSLAVRVEHWPIAGSFTISRGAKTEAVVVVAELSDGRHHGRGECVPYARYDETVASVTAALRGHRQAGARARSLRPAAGDAAGRRAQRARLRVLGSRGEARRPAGARARRPRRAEAARHRLHHLDRQAAGDGERRQGRRVARRCSRSSSAARRRSRAHRGGARRRAELRIDRRRQRRLDRRTTSPRTSPPARRPASR